MRRIHKKLWGELAILCIIAASHSAPLRAQPPDTHPFLETVNVVPLAMLQGLTGAPTRVSLRYHQTDPEIVFAELFRQSQVKIKTYPDELWQSLREGKKLAPISVEVNDVSFWDAARELCENTGLSLEPRAHASQMMLGTGWAFYDAYRLARSPALDVGWFYIQPRRIGPEIDADHRGEVPRDVFRLDLRMYADPVLQWMRAVSPEIEECVDEHGHSLLGVYGHPADYASPGGVKIRLQCPTGNARRIVRLRGKILCFVATDVETWQVPLPLELKPGTDTVTKELAFGRGSESYRLSAAPNRPYSLSASYTHDTPRPEPGWNPKGEPWPDAQSPRLRRRYHLLRGAMENSAWVRDKNENRYDSTGSGNGWNGYNLNGNMSFNLPPPGETETPGASGNRYTFIWKIPRSFVAVEIPFAFENLPIPEDAVAHAPR